MKSIKCLLTKEKNYLKNKFSEEFIYKVGVICSEYLGGEWENININNINIQNITGGNTNYVFKISLNDIKVTPVLLRIYGTDCDEEIFKDTLLFSILSEKELGPKFLGYFPGGRLEEFIESRALTTEEFGYPSILKVLARKVACIHSLKVPLPKKSQIFEMIRSEIKKIKDATTSDHFIKILTTKVFNLKHPLGVTIQQLEEEVTLIENFVKQFNFNIVFSHNDIFEGNVIIRNNTKLERNKIFSNDENNSIIIIDYEYSCYNYRGFDFGQIFCETGISYDANFLHGYEINQELMTNNENNLIFINEYVKEINKLNNIMISGEQFEKDVSQLLFEAKLFIQIVNLYWGVWNIRQGLVSTVKTYNFTMHGLDRLALYYDKQHELLNVK
ncbi:Protein kinase-like domain-containing protein [Strongyloides ratti]|uniref:Protein kinase-like domain-containing protein n=1 Tax=Strongyloides ratti TaxID=34506 RepID=A0A090KUH7_STRRB|nr:Protein kinase-like domain-containing protein [Strongyloides ratti]CEF61071.1 Protein kinase-like domain-containing protein [Strongyloides ratti]